MRARVCGANGGATIQSLTILKELTAVVHVLRTVGSVVAQPRYVIWCCCRFRRFAVTVSAGPEGRPRDVPSGADQRSFLKLRVRSLFLQLLNTNIVESVIRRAIVVVPNTI